MNSQFNWNNIISFNGSQNNAFEELLCQLADKEIIKNKKSFIKAGNPDAGVECYIVLENGNEIGFQAKWFLSSPQTTQWNQIEKSFKTALKKHPKMTTYYVAIPLDRADPRIDNRQSFMDKWNEIILKWKQFTKDTYNKKIDFIYWGSSEFITRLSREENIGLKSFFFGEIDLSDRWFKENNELSTKELGARYTPEVNIELGILKNFDALSRNKRFKDRIDDAFHIFMVSYRKIQLDKSSLSDIKKQLDRKITNMEELYFNIKFLDALHVNDKQLNILLEEISLLSDSISDSLSKLNQKEIKEKNIKTSHGYRSSTTYDSYIRDFRDYSGCLYELKGLVSSTVFKFVNNPFMILDGEAGIGKSHLLADIVNERMKDNQNSIFLLGQHFRQDKAPWSQIMNDLLILNCNEKEFLSALNTKAQAQKKRIIIFIDAINEGKGRNFWNEFLISFIESIKKHEWLGLVISIRTSYFDLIVPKKTFEANLAIPITHFGFDEVQYDASKLFFQYYGIDQPSIPLLHPEFSNPLFLKLFCEGLNKRKLTKIPDGYEGISNIIKFFIEGIEEKLSKKYPNIKHLELIKEIINVLIPQMIDTQTISYKDAYKIIEKEVALLDRIQSGLLDDLISEGLFTKNIFYENNNYTEGIYFVYERFEDHLKVKYLFDKYLNSDNPKISFKKLELAYYFEDYNSFTCRGMIEAMSIQLPENCDTELFELFPDNQIVIDGFLDSLMWRKTQSITQKTKKTILKNITNTDFQKDIFKMLFSTASNPDNPLNGDFLYSYLSKLTMKERDVFLIPLLNDIYLEYDANPIKRLLDWAWSDEEKKHISDESILLSSITLSWLLTSSNRELRDSSTKALISILQNRVLVVLKLLKKFEDINEPYIYERLFAVTFGVVVKIENNDNLKELGEYIYQTIFAKDEVYPHILLRDYAKNCISYISYLGIKLNIDLHKINPPYKSSFPSIANLPTNEEIDVFQDDDKYYHQSNIISSMITEYGRGTCSYGDFGRYTLGYALDDFDCSKDEQLISNYATKKIFEEYGYDGKYFNKAEKQIAQTNNYNRNSHITERIGKKYQWIAFHDTLARVTDNFKMFDNSNWTDKKQSIPYKGTFEPSIRDIDPTILLKETKKDKSSNNDFWWNPKFDFNWNMDNKKWISSSTDIPNIKKLVELTDENNDNWISLNSYPEWREPLKKGFDRWKTTHKYLWNQLRSYIIPKKDLPLFKEWAKKQFFYGRWMPESRENHRMFNREYYWSDAYKFFQNPYYSSSSDWTELDNGYTKKVAPTSENYFWSNEFDYSKKDVLNILKPSKIIFDGLKMQYAKEDGEYTDNNNDKICFESSVNNNSFQNLLVNREKLFMFLEDNDLTIFWVNIGEKRVHTKGHSAKSFLGLTEISSYAFVEDNEIISPCTKLMTMDSNRTKTFDTI